MADDIAVGVGVGGDIAIVSGGLSPSNTVDGRVLIGSRAGRVSSIFGTTNGDERDVTVSGYKASTGGKRQEDRRLGRHLESWFG